MVFHRYIVYDGAATSRYALELRRVENIQEDVDDHGRLGYLAETRYGRRGAPASRVRCGLICGVLTAMSHIRYSSIRMLQDT